ncbi:DUF3347 domain-containing protein [Flavobacterium sp. RSSA_27]|uniref:DUF3347 domain-containing protein n=1 Tax=Flavobacterium sp. RSSA_27 TaxID=3447667 RepID=UPI003F3616BA
MVALLSMSVHAQIKNVKTETVKIYGNCGMCEKTIEKTGNIKNVAIVDWNADTKMASLTYDAQKTNQDEILKRIALSGYDSDKFLAPDEAYSKLPGCCQYEREAKVPVKIEAASVADKSAQTIINTNNQTSITNTQTGQLKTVFDAYFELKDALVKTDGTSASAKASALLSEINAVKMETLTTDEHMVWMKIWKELKEHSEHIADTKDIKHQRDHFMDLSNKMHELIKVVKSETPVYFQFCPMANSGKGANWLSKEDAIKNPYYGSQMLSCGKTIETIK